MKKLIKYELIRKRLIKKNVFELPDNITDEPIVYLFFVACGRNMGDHAIVKAEEEFIRNELGSKVNIIEIVTSQAESAILKLRGRIRSKDLIVLSGGGYIGDEYIEVYRPLRRILQFFTNNKIIIFPQTIYFHGKKRETNFFRLCPKCKNLVIFVREKKSYEILKQYGIKSELIPDIVLSQPIREHKKTLNVLLCLREDVERGLSENDTRIIKDAANQYGSVLITDTVEIKEFKQTERFEYLNNKLEQFSNSSLVMTDRIHGMIFAYLTNTPCLVFGNYNHKVEYEYEWLRISPKIEFLKKIDTVTLNEAINRVLSNAGYTNQSLCGQYERLGEILRKYYEQESI